MSQVLRAWEAVRGAPFGLGPWIYSWLVLWRAPYSASVSPRVIEFKEGFCKVQITERFGLKNPFNSIHAVALANAGELASGLSMMSALESQNLMGIVTRLDTVYFKKARGTVTAVSAVDVKNKLLADDKPDGKMDVLTDIFDQNNEKVASVTASWTIKRRPSKK